MLSNKSRVACHPIDAAKHNQGPGLKSSLFTTNSSVTSFPFYMRQCEHCLFLYCVPGPGLNPSLFTTDLSVMSFLLGLEHRLILHCVPGPGFNSSLFNTGFAFGTCSNSTQRRCAHRHLICCLLCVLCALLKWAWVHIQAYSCACKHAFVCPFCEIVQAK